MLCIYCQLRPRVRKSHIIPEFLYKQCYGKNRELYQLEEGKVIARPQKGYYEPLLCQVCEGDFNSKFEQPNVKLFNDIRTCSNDESGSFVVPKSLPLMILSILWKADHSERRLWNFVNLGEHRNKIRELLEKNAFDQEYRIWILMHEASDSYNRFGIVSTIQAGDAEGLRVIHFFASGVQFIVMLSSAPLKKDRGIPLSVGELFHLPVCSKNDCISLRQL